MIIGNVILITKSTVSEYLLSTLLFENYFFGEVNSILRV